MSQVPPSPDSPSTKDLLAALRTSEQRFKELADLLPQTVFEIDLSLRFIYVNRHGLDFTGYRIEDIERGMGVLDVVHSEDIELLRRNLTRRLRGGPESEMDYRVVKLSGEVAHVRVHSSLIRHDHQVVGLRGVVVDMTEVRRIQELATRAQRLETAGRVAGQVAHDFNNLLGPLMAYPELIRNTLPSDHLAHRYASAMLEAVCQLSEINQQLLTLGRRGHYEPEPLSWNEIVGHVVTREADYPAELAIETALASDLLPVMGGRAQLVRVVSNLVTNARQAMEDRGRIRIQTRNVYLETPGGQALRVPQGEYAVLSIADGGPGIAPEHRSRIFDPFFTTKSPTLSHGSGLGLSTVHAVVEDHGGYVDFETELGRGTEFSVYLPTARNDLAPTSARLDELVGNADVLVVDDDDAQREIARSLLETLGHRVRTAGSGDEALEQIAEQEPDVLVLDLVMPGGLDGAETWQRARHAHPNLKAVLISGVTNLQRWTGTAAEGVSAFLHKPLTLSTIGRAVREALASSSDRPGQVE